MNQQVFTHALRCVFVLALWSVVPVLAQQVAVKDAWIRATVPGQNATGAFMELTSKTPARLVSVTTPLTKNAEVHNMTMENGVMKMFPVKAVDLPVGTTVKFGPGGYHLMLMNLQKPLNAGDKVPLKLTIELDNKKRETIDLSVEVRDLKGQPAMPHQH